MTEPDPYAQYPQVKTKFHQLTESEKAGFLKWGDYSIQQDDEGDDDIIVILDEARKPFSKKGLKRVIKRYFYSLSRPERKQLAKKRKRERKQQLKLTRGNKEKQCDEPPSRKKRRLLRSRNLRALVQDKFDNNPNPLQIVLDCRFDDLMDHQNVVSVANQIRQLYGMNMRAPMPCHLYATSFGGRLKAQFRDKSNDNGEAGVDALDIDVWKMEFIEKSMEEYFEKDIKENKKKEFVYLSADSEEELECVEADKIYVIGAWVDKNAYKGYTNTLAKEHEWKTAKLPILKYMKVNEKDEEAQQTRLVITINQVVAILVAMYNWNNDWRKALQFAFPSRKGFVLREPLNEDEMEQLVFDGHMIPSDSDKYRKGARVSTNK